MTKISKGPPFAKLDGSFYNNPKVIRAGRNGREVFLHVLCCNTKRGAPGYVSVKDIEPWYVAHQLSITEAEASDGVTKAVTAKLIRIDGDHVEIVGWDSDWAWRPLTRAEIQKNYRERKAATEQRYESKVTSYQSSNALPVEERREEERENGNSLSLGSADPDPATSTAPASPRSKRRAAGAVDLAVWIPTAELAALAKQLELDLQHELATFRAYARERKNEYAAADQAAAAFERWMRNSRDTGRKPAKRLAAVDRPRRVKLLDGSTVEREES